MTQDRRITDKLPGQPLQWDDSASPAAAPAAGQAGLAKLEGWRAWLPEHVAGWQDGFGVHRSDIEPEIIIVTVERKQIQLYENEFAFLLDKMLGFVGCDERAAPVAADTEQARPSFYVIVDAQGRAEYVTMLPHEAQEHINDACSEGVEGAGRWKAIPVYAAAVEQAKDAERYRILRGAKKIPASVWHALETGENIDQEVDFLIALNKTIPMCAPCQEGRYNECQHAIPCVLPAASTPVARPNADCSGDPSNCPDNEGYGCECGSGQSPAPVTAEPVATYEGKTAMQWYGSYTAVVENLRRADNLIAHMKQQAATPAPADRDAIPADDVQWGHDLQLRLLAASQDVTESEDARQVMAEAACCLAALTGRPVEQGMERAADAIQDQTLEYRTCCDYPGCLTCNGFGGFYRKRAADAAETRDAKGGEHA